MKGALITLEGIDGTGKTSIWEWLKKELKNCIFTREPTETDFGNMVKKKIYTSNNPLSDLFLFMADHARHVTDVIVPSIKSGKLVICDRYIDSRIAYQGAELEKILPDSINYIRELHSWSFFPDLTILLTADIDVALSRCSPRESLTKFEREEFLKKVQDNYLKIAAEEEERFITVDSNEPLEKVKLDVLDIIKEFLDRKL